MNPEIPNPQSLLDELLAQVRAQPPGTLPEPLAHAMMLKLTEVLKMNQERLLELETTRQAAFTAVTELHRLLDQARIPPYRGAALDRLKERLRHLIRERDDAETRAHQARQMPWRR